MTLAICTIMANERPYVEEWTAFHRKQGVSHFRVYIDRTRPELGDDGTADALRAMPDVDVVDWVTPGPTRQVAAFADGARMLADRAQWVAFIDADEFLYHPEVSLPTWLHQFHAVAAIAVQQTVFGSAGRLTMPREPVTSAYTLRATRDYPEHLWFKSIVQPSLTNGWYNSHEAYIRHALGYVLGDGKPFTSVSRGRADRIATSGPRLHHYMLKSREEWLAKKSKGALSDGASPGFKRFTDLYHERDKHCNVVRDTTLVGMV